MFRRKPAQDLSAANASSRVKKARGFLSGYLIWIKTMFQSYANHDPLNHGTGNETNPGGVTSRRIIGTWKLVYCTTKSAIGIILLLGFILVCFIHFEGNSHGFYITSPSISTLKGPITPDGVILNPSILPLDWRGMKDYEVLNYPNSVGSKNLAEKCDYPLITCDDIAKGRLFHKNYAGNDSETVFWNVQDVRGTLSHYLRANPSDTCACARYHGVCAGSFMAIRQGTTNTYSFIINPKIRSYSNAYYIVETSHAFAEKEKVVKRYGSITLQYNEPGDDCTLRKSMEISGDCAFCVHSCLLINENITTYLTEPNIEINKRT